MSSGMNLGKNRLGALEQRFLSYAQLRGLSVIRTGELRAPLALTDTQEKKTLSRLARAGVVARLMRGVYLFPPRLPVGGVWNPGEYLVLRELMRACDGGSYQMCGWQAFYRYGLTGQVPTRVYAYNDRISGDREIAGLQFTFIEVSGERLGDTVTSATPDGVEVVWPTAARALMDAVYDWSRFGTLPAAYGWIREAVGKESKLGEELARVSIRYGNQGTIRRIGYVLDGLGLGVRWKARMLASLRKSTSLIPLVPRSKARGKIDRAWGVIDNG